MSARRFGALMAMTAAACILFAAGDDFPALVVAAAILVTALWPQKRRQS
jgi:hypothetical protein